MKSKAGRLGSDGKLNMVQATIVHAENIDKEMKYFDTNRTEHFQLNPNHVFLLPDKPNYVKPSDLIREKNQDKKKTSENVFGNHYTDDPVEEAFSNEKLQKTLQTVTLIPRQKYMIPQTRNQEVGWFCNQLNSHKKPKDHSVRMNEITKFVQNYYQMTKMNPFQKTGAR